MLNQGRSLQSSAVAVKRFAEEDSGFDAQMSPKDHHHAMFSP